MQKSDKIKQKPNETEGDLPKGPFKYYVIMFLTFLGPPTHLFDDLQYTANPNPVRLTGNSL